MNQYENVGLSLKLMSVLCGINLSTLYKYAKANDIDALQSTSKRGAKYSISSTRKILKHFFSDKHPIEKSKMKLAEFHFKGGTGKSSLTVEKAVQLALLGYKVLVIDGDQQGHASNTLGLDYSKKFYTLFDCLKNNLSIYNVIINLFEGLDCIPANLSLAGIDEILKEMNEHDRIGVLKKLLSPVENVYDFIIFDTAPSVTDLNRNIFYYADVLNIICDTQPQSVQSLSHILEYLNKFYKKYDQNLPDIMIIPNKYEDRMSSSVETMSYLKNNWGNYIIPDFAIRKSEDFPRAFLEQIPFTFFCKANSIAFEDVSQVVRSIVDKCEVKRDKNDSVVKENVETDQISLF